MITRGMWAWAPLMGVWLAFAWVQPARAQAAKAIGGAQGPRGDQPVAFTADSFDYDRVTGIVTASGHVEAWQGDHVLRADRITFDRNTNVAAASGNVVLVEPDGQVLFADYAELTQGMREGVLKDMRALLPQNGRMAANGARRVEGKVNELTHAVYTTCNICKTDPTKPPLWQLRALSATQDVENKQIEYRDMSVDMFGIPVAYFPYFSHADPSVRRASGFLVPNFGTSVHIGAFLQTPYYQVLGPSSDVVITPMITSEAGPQLSGVYRRLFNNGSVNVDAGAAYEYHAPQGYVFADGTFNYNDTWRYGIDINRASNANYLADFKVNNFSVVLTTSAHIEGFGVGSYTKLDSIAYQGLTTSIVQNTLPYVLPRYEYSYFSEPDALGGRTNLDFEAFNVVRQVGTNTRQAGLHLQWERPFTGLLGEQYKLILRGDEALYSARELDQQPTYGTATSAQGGHGQPTAAVQMEWPFMRSDATTGTVVIEPIVQLVAAPNSGSWLNRNIPNEDSLDFEFTDSTLFSLNRFAGVDRFEGGLRANVGVHTNWTLGGASVDSLIGQSYQEHVDSSVPIGYGLNHRISDIVGRTTFTPAAYLDLTARGRVDPRNGNITFAEAVGSAGVPKFRVSAGYLYSSINPYYLFDTSTRPSVTPPNGYPLSYFIPRDEVSINATSQFGPYKFSAGVRRDLTLSKLDTVNARATYENECFIFDVNLFQEYLAINGQSGGTTLMFTITLKTVGQFGYHA